MKLLFFSAQRAEVEHVRKEFVDAGISCEVHEGGPAEGEVTPDPELWIHNDSDSHKAKLLCVERRMGFAKLAPREEEVIEPEPEPDARAVRVEYFD
jgi:hypothetical protein